MKPAYELQGKPKLVIVDGAGTLFDPGSVIPAYAFQGSFKNTAMENDKPYNISVEFSTVMKHMGMDKLQHVKNLLSEQEVIEQFNKNLNRNPTDNDAQLIYAGFKDQLYPSAAKTEEIEGAKEAAYRLKEAGIPLVMTTGYDRRMVNETSKKLPWLSDVLLASFTSNDVKKGRPAPYLIFHSMEAAGVENPAYAVKVGDTEVDMGAPDNAHMPGIIVLTGSLKEESTEKVDETLNRKHLVLPSLEDVVDYAINDELGGIIKELNKF